MTREWYDQGCAVLRLPPLRDPYSPAQRRAHLPAWLTPAHMATTASRDKITAWVDAGSPVTDAAAIARRFLCQGSVWAASLFKNHLLGGQVPPPASWYVIERTATLTVGRECKGQCIPSPSGRFRRILQVDDSDDAADVLSVWLHECAHAVLLPEPVPLDELEEVAYYGVLGVVAAEAAGADMQAIHRRAVLDESQAARLAREWGAIGFAADPEFTAEGPALAEARARAALGEP